MEAQKVRMTFLDGREVDFETTTMMCTADRIAWERLYGLKTGALTEADLTEEHLLWFAWRAGQRANAVLAGIDFEAFLELADTWEIVGEAQAVSEDPTPAPSG